MSTRRAIGPVWLAGMALLLLPAVAHAAGMQFAPEGRSEEFAHAVEAWHEFYLMSGTASVTLVGLLFVAISMHLEVLVHDKRAHLLDLARQTLLAFIYILLVSLMVLIPPSTPRMLGVTIGGATLVVLVFSAVGMAKEMRLKELALTRKNLFRRRAVQIIALLYGLFGAWQLWGGSTFGLFVLIFPVCTMLGNATGSAWDLLVQVGRLKVRLQEEDARD